MEFVEDLCYTADTCIWAIHVLPPVSETLAIASIPHIVALEVELSHGL